MLVAETII